MNILQAFATPDLFGDRFNGSSREAMRSVLAGAFAIDMTSAQRDLFNKLAGGRKPPTKRVSELYIIAGRRSEKTGTAAGIAVYLGTIGAAVEGLASKLKAGERGVIALVATDRSQAKIALGYIVGMLEESPVFRRMIQSQDAEAIHLNNQISIEVSTGSFRALRGRTLLAVIFDELAFFRSDSSANPDVELYRAALPGLATTNGLLIGISSPYARTGLLFDKWRKHYAQGDDDVLVMQGASKLFNPTLDDALIERALIDDPEGAKSEWLGQWRDGISSFMSREVLDDATRQSPLILPPREGCIYVGFVDPAGGGQSASADEFTMAVGHVEQQRIVVDGVWGRKGNPAAIIEEYADLLRGYRINKATSDRYAGQYPATEFKRWGITLEYSTMTRSQLYLETAPMLNTGRVELPPDQTMLNQFAALERRTGRAGDVIDHPQYGNAHDDRCNAAAGLIAHLGVNRRSSYTLDNL